MTVPARRIIALYAKRMQIEEAFWDLKATRYGLGLELSLTRDAHRLRLLLLIGALALFALWLTGCAALPRQYRRPLQSDTILAAAPRSPSRSVRHGLDGEAKSHPYHAVSRKKHRSGSCFRQEL